MKRGAHHTASLVCLAVIALVASHPAGNKGPHIVVLSNSLHSNDHDIDGGMSTLAAALRMEGYRVSNRRFEGFTDKSLAGIDVLVVALPAFSLDEDDREALSRFLAAGGGLLVAVYPKIYYLDSIDLLLRDFGISLGNQSWDELDANIPAKCALAKPRTCSLVGGLAGRIYLGIDGKRARSAASTASGVLAAVSCDESLGSGRLVALGTDRLLSYNFIDRCDNLAFLLNSFDYLCGAGECDLTVLKVTFGGKSAVPGDELKVTARLKNVGPAASAETKIRFMICKEIPDGSPSKAVKKYKPTALEEIAPGKKWKVKAVLKIPASIEPGEYYIAAVADPGGKTGDPFFPNNTKASTKKLVIE